MLRDLRRIATTLLKCAALIALLFWLWWYIGGLRGPGDEFRIGLLVNPEAPEAEWRYAPARDVAIFVRWNVRVTDSPIQWSSECVRTLLVRSDSNGRVAVNAWWMAPKFPPRIVSWPNAYEIQPGLFRPPGAFKPWANPPQPMPEGYSMILIAAPAEVAPWPEELLDDDPRVQARRDRCPSPEQT